MSWSNIDTLPDDNPPAPVTVMELIEISESRLNVISPVELVTEFKLVPPANDKVSPVEIVLAAPLSPVNVNALVNEVSVTLVTRPCASTVNTGTVPAAP